MKITCIHAPIMNTSAKRLPQIQPPLGFAYVVAAIREQGYPTRVIDGLGDGIGKFTPYRGHNFLHGLTMDEVLERIEPDTDVVTLSVMFSNYWVLSRDLIRAIRARYPRILIVGGGEHVSACPELVLRDGPVDFAVMGEGEETIVELLAYLSGSPEAKPPERILGLAYKTPEGRVVVNAKRPRHRAPDDFPWPAWDLFPMEKYMEAELYNGMSYGRRSLVMLGTRGCPYTCKFCSNEGMWGINYFTRSPKNIVDEMESYIKRYGATDFQFQDLTFVINARWTKAFAQEIIDRKLDVTWKLTSGTRCEAMDAEVLEKMSQSGCKEIFLAPESGSERILEINRKRVDLKKLIEVGRMVQERKIDMQISAYIIMGFPEETLEDIFKTWGLLAKLAWNGFNTAFINRFTAYPGSEYHDIAIREGRIRYEDDYFLNLERNFSILNSGRSWHPRWSGRFVFALMLVGYAIYFSAYYLRNLREFFGFIPRICKNKPKSRLERYFAYRIWQPLK